MPDLAETAQCGASTLGPVAGTHIGPCVLRHGHDGPIHEDANGVHWAGLVGRPPEPEQDVPDELLDMAWRAELARRSPKASAEQIEEYCDFETHPSMASHREELRPVVAAVLTAHERMVRGQVMAELFGPRKNLASGRTEPGTVDDTVALCEKARPGEHEQRIREQAAREIHDRAAAYADAPTGPRASFRRGMEAAAQHILPAPLLQKIADAIARGETTR